MVAGTSVELEGTLVKSLGKEQALELQVSNMKVIGSCDAEVRFNNNGQQHSFDYVLAIRTNSQIGSYLYVTTIDIPTSEEAPLIRVS